MKKQIFFTFFVLSCALLVFTVSFLSVGGSDDRVISRTLDTGGVLSAPSAALPPASQAEVSFSRPSLRLYLFRGLPYTLNKMGIISITQIMLMAIFIGLFIKPSDPKTEFILDSDGMK